MATTGRPKTEISEEQFKSLCGLQCTLGEIAWFFHCSEDTVERWCKRELKTSFADAFKKYSAAGKISLRRNQFALAKKSATMAIWLGKQYLGQKEVVDDGNVQEDALKEIVASIDKLADKK